MTDAPVLRLNPALDPAAFAQAYARDGFVRIPDVFEPKVADRLAGLLEEAVDWSACAPDAPPETGDYLAYPMLTARAEGRDPGHPLHIVTAFLTTALPDLAQAVTDARLILRDAEARLYGPAHFRGLSQNEGVGFGLGFTRWWRPDWGGQLLLHDDEGDIVRGLAPRLGDLVLFQAGRPHSIAPVAPMAPRPRLALEGLLA